MTFRLLQHLSPFPAGFKPLGMALALGLVATLPAEAPAAETREQASFDLELRGVRAGRLQFSATSTPQAYSAAVRLQSTGLVNLVRSMRYDGQAQGRIVSGQPVPQRHQNAYDNGRRETSMLLEFANHTPVRVEREPDRELQPHDLDPASQTGTMDIVTALFAVFREVPRDSVCNLDLAMFDGRRRTQLVVGAPVTSGAGVTCAGEYRRVAGFPPEDMAERTNYPFTLVYMPGDNGLMQLRQVDMESTQGRGRLIRR